MDIHVLQTSSRKIVPSRNKEGTIQSKNKIAETWVCKRKSPGHTRRSPAVLYRRSRVVECREWGAEGAMGTVVNRGRMAQGWNEEF